LQHKAARIVANPVILLQPELCLLYRCNCVRKSITTILLRVHFPPGIPNMKFAEARLAVARGCDSDRIRW
jgi:hypothetical protein